MTIITTSLQELYIYFYHLLKISPAIIYSSCLLAFIITKNKFYVFLLLATCIFGDVMVHQEKKIFKNFLPPKLLHRPCARVTGCDKSIECGIFPRANKNHVSYGFPSGHSQIAAFAAVLMSFYIWNSQVQNKKITIFTLWVLVFLIAWQRWHSNCHTWIQIIFGWFFGILFGLILWHLIGKKIISNRTIN